MVDFTLDDYQPEDRAATYREQDRITKIIDEKRAAFLASGVPDDFDPFAPLSDDEERQERRLAEMDAWGEAYGCLDDDQDEDAGE